MPFSFTFEDVSLESKTNLKKNKDAGLGDEVICSACEVSEHEVMFCDECATCGYYFCEHCWPSHDDCEPPPRGRPHEFGQDTLEALDKLPKPPEDGD